MSTAVRRPAEEADTAEEERRVLELLREAREAIDAWIEALEQAVNGTELAILDTLTNELFDGTHPAVALLAELGSR